MLLMAGTCGRRQGGGLKAARGGWREVAVEGKASQSGTFQTLIPRLWPKSSMVLSGDGSDVPAACRHTRPMAICLFSFFGTSTSRRREMGGRDNVTEVVVTVAFLETIAQKAFLKTHFSRCSKVKSSTVFLREVHVCFHSNSFNSFRQLILH